MGSLYQYAQGTDNTGGIVTLEYREFEVDEWLEIGNEPWSAGFNWSAVLPLNLGFYRATEIGNGTAYVGTSAYSAVFEYDPP
jgi:hypothetical protein